MRRIAVLILAIGVLFGRCAIGPAPVIDVATASAQIQGMSFDDSNLATISGVEGVSTSGGNSTVIGSGFTTTTQAQLCLDPCTSSAWISPNPAVTYSSSTQITIAVPALAAGTYDLILSDSGGFLASAPAVLVVQAVGTPATCASTYASGSLIGWFRGDSLDGGYWQDKSAYGQNLVVDGSPYLNSTDPHFNEQPTIYFDGGANYASVPSGFSIHGSTTIWTFIVSRDTSTANATLNSYAIAASINSNILRSAGVANTTINSTNWTNLSVGWFWYGQGDGGSEYFGTQIGIGGSPSTYGPGSPYSLPLTSSYSIPGTSAWPNMTYADIVVLNTIPSGAYYACIYDYANVRYALDSQPTIIGVTPTQTTGGPIRYSGTNFGQGATTTVGGVIGESGSATYITANSAAFYVDGGPFVVGSNDVTHTNADSESTTAPGALTVESTLDPWNIVGANTVGWFRADQIASPVANPVTGSAVSGWPDISRLYNDLSQGTSANQPTWNSANSCAGGQPTVHFAGSQWLANTAFNIVGSTTGNALYVWMVFCEANAPASGNYTFVSYGSGVAEMRIATTGDPTFLPGVSLSTSVVDGGTANALMGFALNTNATEWNLGISLNNGTYTYADAGSSVINSGGTMVVGARTTSGTNSSSGLDIAEIGFFDTQLTATQLSQLQTTYAHGIRGYF